MSEAEFKDKKEKNKKMETISFEQFKGIDLRVGEIKEAETD